MTATATAGERYYRHPGDLLRLITWAVVAAVLVVHRGERRDERWRRDR